MLSELHHLFPTLALSGVLVFPMADVQLTPECVGGGHLWPTLRWFSSPAGLQVAVEKNGQRHQGDDEQGLQYVAGGPDDEQHS